jgi:hypothetical protein
LGLADRCTAAGCVNKSIEVTFTLQTYTHPDEEELDRAAAAFERALGSR